MGDSEENSIRNIWNSNEEKQTLETENFDENNLPSLGNQNILDRLDANNNDFQFYKIPNNNKFEYAIKDTKTKKIVAVYKKNGNDIFSKENFVKVNYNKTPDENQQNQNDNSQGFFNFKFPDKIKLDLGLDKILGDVSLQDAVAGLGLFSNSPTIQGLSQQQVAAYFLKKSFNLTDENDELGKTVDKVCVTLLSLVIVYCIQYRPFLPSLQGFISYHAGYTFWQQRFPIHIRYSQGCSVGG